MQTEFPRQMNSKQIEDGAVFDGSPSAITDDELELIDLRYDQFIAQSTLDHLMDDL